MSKRSQPRNKIDRRLGCNLWGEPKSPSSGEVPGVLGSMAEMPWWVAAERSTSERKRGGPETVSSQAKYVKQNQSEQLNPGAMTVPSAALGVGGRECVQCDESHAVEPRGAGLHGGGVGPKRVRFSEIAETSRVEDFEFPIVNEMLILGVLLDAVG